MAAVALREAGYERRRVLVDGGRVYIYRRPA